MRILQYSLSRSGGTFIWQVLSSLYEVKKTHGFLAHKRYNQTIVVIRDFRDSIFSFIRVHGHDINNLDEKTVVEVTDYYIKQYIEPISKYERKCGDNLIYFRYENFFNNYDYLFSFIEDSFGKKISEQKRKEIIEKTNLKSNKKISDKLGEFGTVDKKSRIHGNHIFSPEGGEWKKHMSEELQEIFIQKLEPHLKKYGYK